MEQQSNVVTPKDFSGWGFSLHPDGPKFDIVCGKCGGFFRARIPRTIPWPKIPCSSCGVLNLMPIVPGSYSG